MLTKIRELNSHYAIFFFIFNILSVNFCSVEGGRQLICQKNLFLVLTRYSLIFKSCKPNGFVIC